MAATDRPQTEDQGRNDAADAARERAIGREGAGGDRGGKHGADEQTRAGTPMTLPRN